MNDDDFEETSPEISAYMSRIGKLGGKKGGIVCGPTKRRTREHYQKMVDARNAQRAAARAAKRDETP